MSGRRVILVAGWLTALAVAPPPSAAASRAAAPEVPLTEAGQRCEAKYAAVLAGLRSELAKDLPELPEQKRVALQQAQAALKQAEAGVEAARKPLDAVTAAEGLVGHAKNKWIREADQGIAAAQAALQKAATDAARAAAQEDLSRWQANREDGVKALRDRQAVLDLAKLDAPRATQQFKAAEAALALARSNEQAAVSDLLAIIEPLVAGDRHDAKLVQAAVLAGATPKGLAAFAQQGPEHEALIERLLADAPLMQDMLVAGGANGGQYGPVMQIYSAIRRARPTSAAGLLHRLALATSLEFSVPVQQSHAASQTNGPPFVDPVKRFLHYEKAYLDGELDAAFKQFTAWELRMVVDCDAPDHVLAWGREMLRTYRPDHVTNPDYGWRYSGAVRTDVSYGSQHVQDDLPTLHAYQNIPRNGGVCGRRAFFGRFILKCFGIPVWGVTQHKHAALSHWTPKGWVINLGAGFHQSWWDKDDAPRSGSDFLLETQARADAAGYQKVLRAQWVSCMLGEEAFSDRKKVAGGIWSNLAHHQAARLAARAVALGPLGQALGEANESPEQQVKAQAPAVATAPQAPAIRDGAIVLPAPAFRTATGPKSVMSSFSGGTQLHAGGGFKAQYAFEAPQAGTYALTARVATLQDGQVFRIAANAAQPPTEAAVPYTIGLWQTTRPVHVALLQGPNTLHFEIRSGSRGVTIKDFTLTPAK